MHFGTSLFEGDFVHRDSHQPDTTPVVGTEIFGTRRIGNRFRVKSLSLVLDDQGYPLFQVTAATNLNQLVTIETIAVNHCIVESFPKSQFNRGLLAGNATRSFDQSHQTVDQWGDGFDFTRHPGLDLEGRTCPYAGKLRFEIWRSLGGLCLSHDQRLTPGENASRGPKRHVFLKYSNLLICHGMRRRDAKRSIDLPRWHCQWHGTLPVLWRTKVYGGSRTFQERSCENGVAATQNRVRFRACAFSIVGWTVSFQDAPLPRWDLPQPNRTA